MSKAIARISAARDLADTLTANLYRAVRVFGEATDKLADKAATRVVKQAEEAAFNAQRKVERIEDRLIENEALIAEELQAIDDRYIASIKAARAQHAARQSDTRRAVGEAAEKLTAARQHVNDVLKAADAAWLDVDNA